MADQLSPWILGGDCHIYPTRRQVDYIQRCSTRLGAAATWRRQGAESGEDGTYDHEGWKIFHYDATARGGLSAEIDGERTAFHDINADREGFSYHSACPFIATFSSVFHTPELGLPLKSNNLENGEYFFLHGSFTPSTSSIYSCRENITLDVR